MMATHWRWIAAVACLAAGFSVSWFTSGGWLLLICQAVALAVPALVTVALAPAWRSGAPITAVLLAGLAGAVVLSTHRPGAVRPPQTDWLLPYVMLAVLSWAVAFAFRIRHAPAEHRRTLLGLGAGGVVVLFCVGAIAASGPGEALPGSGKDLMVDRADLLPFPAGLGSIRIGADCQTGSGVCTEYLQVWSLAGRPPAEIAEQLAQHLRGKGWPMTAEGDGHFVACRPMRGVLSWIDQICVRTLPADDADLPPNTRLRHESAMVIIGAPASA